MCSLDRWIVPFLALFLILAVPAANAAIDGALVLVKSDDQDALGLLAAHQAPVHYQTGWQVIARVETGTLAQPEFRRAVLLDTTPWEKGEAYYWIFHPGRKDAEHPGADLLYRDGLNLLVKTSAEQADLLARQGWEIALVPQQSMPLRSTDRQQTEDHPAPEFGGVVDQMVGEVETATYEATLQSLVDFGTRYVYADENVDAADYIHSQMTSFGLEVERHQFNVSPLARENIIATIPGEVYPDEVLFIIAHFDSISDDPYNAAPGADDNGTGTTAVIEAARVLAGYSFERTIKLACFSGEEVGLVGSWAYASEIAAAGMNVVGCINFDMIGYSGSDPAPADLIIYTNTNSMSVAEQLRDAALHYFPDDLEPVILNENMTASDHASFWNQGYPAIFGCEAEPWTADFNPVYHTTNDLPDILDMEYAANVCRSGVAAVAEWAVPLDLGDIRLLSGPGAGPDNPPTVRVFPPEQDATPVTEFTAYGATGFGVNVAAGNLDGDSDDEILTGPGPGAVYGPHVRGFEPDGTQLPGLNFFAYGTLKYGVNVVAGDLDGDGTDEIITGAGPGAVFGPHVRAFSYDGVSTVTPLSGVSFFAYGSPKWGVNLAAGDLDGDGDAEIVTGAGPGAIYGPHVRGWRMNSGTAESMSAVNFMAYGSNHYGVRVACGDIDGDGMDELVTAPGPSSQFAAHIRGWNFDGSALSDIPQVNFLAWPSEELRYGALVNARADLDGDGLADLVVAAGPDPTATTPVKVYSFTNGTTNLLFSLEAFDGTITHGSSVAAGKF